MGRVADVLTRTKSIDLIAPRTVHAQSHGIGTSIDTSRASAGGDEPGAHTRPYRLIAMADSIATGAGRVLIVGSWQIHFKRPEEEAGFFDEWLSWLAGG